MKNGKSEEASFRIMLKELIKTEWGFNSETQIYSLCLIRFGGI